VKAIIHRGAREIGGSCVELECQGQRLVLDIGRPLEATLDDHRFCLWTTRRASGSESSTACGEARYYGPGYQGTNASRPPSGPQTIVPARSCAHRIVGFGGNRRRSFPSP
jgi:hypothetical protein